MGMGGCDIQLGAGKSSARRPPTGLQIAKSGGCIKPRIIHTYSPKVYKIKPEEFLDLVQKLTGRPEAEEETSTYQFFGNEPKVERMEDEEDEDTPMSPSPAPIEREFQILKPTSEALGTPVSNQLLASLTRPKERTLMMPVAAAAASSSQQREPRSLRSLDQCFVMLQQENDWEMQMTGLYKPARAGWVQLDDEYQGMPTQDLRDLWDLWGEKVITWGGEGEFRSKPATQCGVSGIFKLNASSAQRAFGEKPAAAWLRGIKRRI